MNYFIEEFYNCYIDDYLYSFYNLRQSDSLSIGLE